jgi:predicted esterase YcpF (UPF0227 family)
MIKDIKVVYLHGYGSSSDSDKVKGLREYFFDVYAPDIPILWDEAEAVLKDFIDHVRDIDDRPMVIVGTSLGGYWATRMSTYYRVPSVIINPSTDPALTLGMYQNPALTKDELRKYVSLKPGFSAPRTVLLAMDDEVIPPCYAQNLFHAFCDVVEFPKMGHRFESINIIADYIIETAGLDYLSNDNI